MNSNPGKILIVEDSRTERLILQRMVGQGGYEVLTAEDGIVGLELAITLKPDVILSDIVMPRLTGLEMCQMLKSRDDTRYIPVVFISALDNMEQVVAGLEAGASDYLSKHIDSHEEVLKIVEVNYHQSLKNRFGEQASIPASDKADGGETQLFMGLDVMDLTSFGVATFSLRKTPIYMNQTARRELNVTESEELCRQPPDRFEQLLQAGVSSYFRNQVQFFHPVELSGRILPIRLEEVQRAGQGICGLLILICPRLVAVTAEEAGPPAASEEEPLLPD